MGLVKITQEKLDSLISAINNRAKKSDVYTKAEADAKIVELAPATDFTEITGKPTTLSGYGITDAAAQKGTATVYGGAKFSLSGSTLTITTI